MGNRKNLRNKTLDDLREDINKAEHQIEVEEHRMNLTRQKMKEAERKARNHRLIVTGAELERVLPEIKSLTEAELKVLLDMISHIPEVRDQSLWMAKYSASRRLEKDSEKEQ